MAETRCGLEVLEHSMKINRRAISRVVRVFSKAWSSATTSLLIFIHRSLNLLRRSKPDHFIVCGPSVDGASRMHEAILKALEPSRVNAPTTDRSAVSTLSVFRRSYITNHPDDLLSLETIKRTLSPIRNIRLIVVISDFGDLLCTYHRRFPEQFYMSWDHSLYLEPHVSFSRPGLFAELEAARSASTDGTISTEIVRLEDISAKSPEAIQALQRALNLPHTNCMKLVESVRNSTGNKNFRTADSRAGRRRRIECQISLYPELKKTFDQFGYRYPTNLVHTSYSSTKGTVVAMHTPDRVYREEASRLRRSLDKLRISHSIDETPEAKELAQVEGDYPEWFIQKLARYYKPTWLMKKRKELRGPILYTDADSFFHRDPWPYLNQYDGDMAVYTRRTAPSDNSILNSAVILINDTNAALEILYSWICSCEEARRDVVDRWPDVRPSASDQPLLRKIINEDESRARNFNIQRLPPTMLHIFDYDAAHENWPIYIEQLQASRVAKQSLQRKASASARTARDRRISQLNKMLDDKA